MKLLLAIVLVSLVACSVNSSKPYGKDWNGYKKAHNKVYSGLEDMKHRMTWAKNKRIIDEHNEKYLRGEVSFSMGINQFTDMSPEERNMYTGLKVDMEKHRSMTKLPWNRTAVLAESLDWREKGAVTPVKNQGQCGSCYSFSATGSLEGHLFKASGKLVSLSEQQIMDCTGFGCSGGWMTTSFDNIKEQGGIQTEESYSYTSKDGSCHFDKSQSVASVSGHAVVDANEEALKDAVTNQGPVAVAINVPDSFFSYTGGVFWDEACDPNRLGHAVLLIGYGTDGDYDYWLVKNSWGTGWGEGGFIKIYKGANMCGISNMASVPTGVSLKKVNKSFMREFPLFNKYSLSLNITQL